MQYAELFCQSNFSFLSGASHAEELVIQADFLRYHAIAITDECSVAGVVRAHASIKQHGLAIKQLIGSMFWLNDECQVLLLCPNRAAYGELCRIITNARRRSEKGSYQLSEWDLMSVRHCLLIWLPSMKPSDNHWGQWLSQHHAGRLWIGALRHLQGNDHSYIHHYQTLAKELSLPVTACGGVLMHTPNRLPLQHTLTAIKLGKSVAQIGRDMLTNTERTLRSKEKLLKLFPNEWLAEKRSYRQTV